MGDDAEQLQRELESLRNEFAKTGKVTADMNKRMEGLSGGMMKFGKEHLGNLGQGVKSFSTQMLAGSKSFDALIPVIDALGGAMVGLAKSVPLVGGGLGKLAQVAVDSSKFLVTELSKQAGVFQSVSRSGVLGAGGMQQFANQAFSSRLSLEQFGKVVVDNGKMLAAMRGSAMSGTKAFADMTSTLSGDQFDFTRQLGYGAEEIADITAGYMSQQTLLGMTQRQSTESLTQSTAGYMKELDMLSRVTGDNRKALQERQAAMLAETRFNAKIQELLAQGKVKEARELQNFVSAVDAFAPAIATGARDIATAGTGTIAEGQQLMIRSGGSIQQILKQIENGSLSSTTALNQLTNQVGQTNQQYISSAKVLGDANMVTANGAEYARLGNRAMQEEAALRKQQADQMKGTDPLQASMARSLKNMEDFTMNLNKMILEFMPMTAKIVEGLTGTLETMMETAKKGFDELLGKGGDERPVKHRSTIDKIFGLGLSDNEAEADKQVADEQLDNRIKRAVENARQKKAAKELTFMEQFNSEKMDAVKLTPEEKAKIVEDEKKSFKESWVVSSSLQKNASYDKFTPDKYAFGGIANYPETGKLAMLHGTEAIIPLPDGKTVPVSINVNSLAEALTTTPTAGPVRSTLGTTSSSPIASALMSMLGIKTETAPATTATTTASGDTDLMSSQNAKLDELIRLTSKHISVSEQTRAHLS